ncbi:hypothetical protein Tco_0503303 [Tanacetum coccineum]
MQGTKLSLQEKECKLYDEFDKFSFVKGETLYQYYGRFSQLINNMNVINMSLTPVQVNTKFLNSLPPKWSKFVMDVKLERDLHTTNYDQLYSYLEQHEIHANETRLMHERYQDPFALSFIRSTITTISVSSNLICSTNSPQSSTQPLTEFPRMDSSLVVLVFNQGDDPIAYLNKAMAFLTAVASSRFPSTNNQLITSSNPRNQATIQDGKVTVQQVQGRQGESYAGNSYKGNATSSRGNNAGGATSILADPSFPDGQAAQTTIPNTAAFQTEDLDAYDFDCNDVSNAKVVLMANLSNYGSDVISKKQNVYNDLSKSFSQLEKHFISLELIIQLNQEIFQKDSVSNNQNALEILEYFKNNNLKAQLQAKDTTICKLKEHIKSMRENEKEENVKHEMDEIKTINIELEHSVAKLLFENERLHKEIEHLKKIYKDQFDSIKRTRALSKEQYASLIAQLNSKSLDNEDLIGQIQEKVFATTALQSELRRLKGKNVLDSATTITNATTIAPRMFKLDIEPLSHRLKNNRDAHEDYLKKTIENTNTIRRLVERARKQNPSKPLLDSACKFTKHV